VNALVLVAAFLVRVSVYGKATNSPASNTFTVTGGMNVTRYGHKTVLLSNGQVLAVTGDTTGTNAAELYDPATGNWTLTSTPATFHDGGSATRLANGQVLLAAGYNPGFTSAPAFIATAELYNPSTGQWSPTGTLPSARRYQAAVLLPNGQVLVAGGQDSSFSSIADAALYNPATGSWQTTASMHENRAAPVAELLGNGTVLVAGGLNYSNGSFVGSLASAEIYNPSTGKWTATATMPSTGSLGSMLSNGDVLVVRDAFFNPATGAWAATGAFPNSAHTIGPSTATLLTTGDVLLTGFRSTYNDTPTLNETVLYNSSTNSYSTAASMNSPRWGDSATLLPNGHVLISGGYVKAVGIGVQYLSSAELYTP
jgi:Kelch motif